MYHLTGLNEFGLSRLGSTELCAIGAIMKWQPTETASAVPLAYPECGQSPPQMFRTEART